MNAGSGSVVFNHASIGGGCCDSRCGVNPAVRRPEVLRWGRLQLKLWSDYQTASSGACAYPFASGRRSRLYDGERGWPEEAPFHTPVYVLTHQKREPWIRPGGTTCYFVNDGPERALKLARQAAADRDVRISGGAYVIQQYLNLGVVDELEIALAPVLFGGGRRLFEKLHQRLPHFRIDRVIEGTDATQIRYVRQ